MLLTISTDYQPATDLGYLLGKHPDRVQSFDLPFGKAYVFYPEASPQRSTAALLLDIDPVGLVRKAGAGGFALEQYINDRAYAASSFLSVAIAQVYRTGLSGSSKDRPELARTAIPLEATLSALPVRGGEALLRNLFEPLGYQVVAHGHVLDPAFPEWGNSRYYTLTLKATTRLQDLLTHLYVLIPVLDDNKHYFVGSDEVDKLLRHGESWLSGHPAKAFITRRYLRYKGSLTRDALSRLVIEESPALVETAQEQDSEADDLEAPWSLHQQRLNTVLAVLRHSGAHRVLDLGCGEGKLLELLYKEPQFTEILGVDVVLRALEIAADRLKLERLPERQKGRLTLLHGSLLYRDPRLNGYDAAAVVEVIEHLDPPRLTAFERVLFEFAHPTTVVITTPNVEYNMKWEALSGGRFRHRDHRFEWTRTEFQVWALRLADQHGYQVHFLPIGDEDPRLGAPSQMAVFTAVERTI